MDVFDQAWEIAASKGKCDARGGMEYTRVRGEWDRLYGKLVALNFICQRANEMPPPHTTEPKPEGGGQ